MKSEESVNQIQQTDKTNHYDTCNENQERKEPTKGDLEFYAYETIDENIEEEKIMDQGQGQQRSKLNKNITNWETLMDLKVLVKMLIHHTKKNCRYALLFLFYI